MIFFYQLENAPEFENAKDALVHIMNSGCDVVRLTRRKLCDLHDSNGFFADAWILPSRNKIQTEDGNYSIPPNVFWRMTAQFPALAPIYSLYEDLEVTPLIFNAMLRDEIIGIDFPVQIQENSLIKLHKEKCDR